ncbi:MAG: S1 family peptidase [Kutzneria sp.]|nr:S1 family peptidase [Kutzneria sp.]
MNELTSIQQTLNALPITPNSSWAIDVATNQVVVQVSDQTPSTSLLETAGHYGDAAKIVHTHGSISQQVLDGDGISTDQITCSAGFNATVGNGQPVILTAGHCTAGLPYWQGIGPSLDTSPSSADYGLIRNDSDDGRGAVDTYNGRSQPITEAGDAYVGERVCKAGERTGLTCGRVTALNVTVNYDNGKVVHGLVETNVHTDHGDSGGPLFDGSVGLGMVSGGDGRSVSYYQPLTDALNAYSRRSLQNAPSAAGISLTRTG